jgi:predicted amidophosphoribosyltransferase
MDPELICPGCKQNISPLYYFCPNCGRKLKDKPQPVTLGRQILVYLLSFLLPPLGLWPGIKYLKQPDKKSKIIGLIAITLTIVSVIITVWLYLGFINIVNQELNRQLNSDLNLYL